MFELSDTVDRKFIESFDISDWDIDTDTGFLPLTHIHKTVEYQEYILETAGGKTLICADTHIVFDERGQQIFVKDCVPGSTKIITRDGAELVSGVTRTNTYSHMYDVTVAGPDSRFYSNDILSHNSTMLDAICFSLFGKPFRNVNKGQLVNSINKKGCVVELEFKIGSKEYKVVRGIKPNKFEIYVDNVLLNQDAASRDYQSYLEDSVLKLNFKSFTQIVILGSASFVPFMQLPAASRREIIEDILDIRIFTTMNGVLKTKIVDSKDKLSRVETELTLAKEKAKLQQSFIKSLMEDRQDRIDEITSKISTIQTNDIVLAERIIKDLELSRQDYNDTGPDASGLRLRAQELLQGIREQEQRLKVLRDDIHFYGINDSCPVCRQIITEQFKEQTVEEKRISVISVQQEIENLKEEHSSIKDRLIVVAAHEDDIKRIDKKIDAQKQEVAVHTRFIQTLQAERTALQTKIGDLDEERGKLRDIAKTVVQLTDERAAINEERRYLDTAAILLKDSGIKTKIIRQYLVTINKLVNKYLHAMDFFVSFELDEEFNEKIKSRHRDEFCYGSFSEGEKQRINLALVFAWRAIAKLKNSTNTNLLILDEVFDSSLDATGTEFVGELLRELGQHTNVWVISHRTDGLQDKFHNTVKFTKKQNFSVMETVPQTPAHHS